MIYKPTCFVCDYNGKKGVNLRGKPLRSNFKVDEVIMCLVENCEVEDIKKDWAERKKAHDDKIQARKIKLEEIDIGHKVDVRDTTYVWCEATVTQIIEQIGKPAIFVVSYKGWSNKWDEFIQIDSNRIAKHGSITGNLCYPFYRNVSYPTDRKNSNILMNNITGDPVQVIQRCRDLRRDLD